MTCRADASDSSVLVLPIDKLSPPIESTAAAVPAEKVSRPSNNSTPSKRTVFLNEVQLSFSPKRIGADATSQAEWTFLALDGRAVAYPSYFISHLSKNRVRLEVDNPSRPDSDPNKSSLRGWYQRFMESVVKEYNPTVRGGISLNARITGTAMTDKTFFGYNYGIALKTAEPAPMEPANNQANLRAAVEKVIALAANDSSSLLPADVEAVDITILIGGDPNGIDCQWKDPAIADEMDEDITLPELHPFWTDDDNASRGK